MDEIKRKGLDKKMSFNFQARGDNVNYKLLKDLYGAGFRSVFFGIETASDRIIYMEDGQIIEEGPPDIIFSNPRDA